MKRIFVFALLALAGVYLTGSITLGEAGAVRFVGGMETHMQEGNADAICAMFHDDLKVNVQDHTGMGGQRKDTTGGKAELCALTRETVDALAKVPHSMSVQFDDVTVKRDWLHPWTSEVSYLERRSFTIRGTNISLNTESEDTITLVQTFSGVKLLELESQAFLAE